MGFHKDISFSVMIKEKQSTPGVAVLKSIVLAKQSKGVIYV
jgi:hypothetical protein